jgi:DNA invertase Pin-like site-specific DNA recombinase
VCHEQSRLTRQPAQWDERVVTLHKAGIAKVNTVQGRTVPVEPGNRLVGRIMSVIDAEEVERTRARILAAHEQLAGEGRPNGGRQYGPKVASSQRGL